MKKQRLGALAAASAGVVSILGLTAPSLGIVIGNFETSLDRWEAVDATGQVQLMSPTVRKRTESSSTVSPARAGVSGVTGTIRPRRRTTGRRWA